jgi:RNA polymerase sigma-70 factor (ECF subfamily)
LDAPSVDLLLSQALARGDRRGAGQLLVVHHADAVYATCRALVRDRVLAEDLSQEAFTKALAALPNFRGESQSRTWLLSIARNVCLDHLRRTKGPIDERAELDVEVQPSEIPPPFELLARRGDVERALGVLSEIERAIVVLHHAHGVGYPELAGSFGIAEGTLRMRMSRALLKMRDALEPEAVLGAVRRRSEAAAPAMAAPAMAAPAPQKSTQGSAPSVPASGVLDRLRAWWQPAAPPAAAPPAPPAAPPAAAPPAPSAPPLGAPPPRAVPRSPVPHSPSVWPSSPAPRPASSSQPNVAPSLWSMPATLRERLLAALDGANDV